MSLHLGRRGVHSRLDLDPMVGVQSISSHEFSLPSRSAQLKALLGLQYHRPFHRDPVFLLLFAFGPLIWLAMIWVFEPHPLPWHAIWSLAFLSVALWQPLFEELLFRGVIQGYFLHSMEPKTRVGLSLANLLTSLSFSLAHLASHSLSWSFLVFVPSLCFGFVRDRFGSVYPAIALHAFYNTGFFLLTGATFLNAH